MQGRSTAYTRGVSGLTALMVLFALMVPLAGAALANHVEAISITPTTDSAPAGTCNAFTVTLLEAGPGNKQVGAEGETVDIIVTDTDADNNANTTGGANESDVVFCDPAETQQEAGQGSDEFGPNAQLAVANNTGRNITDDNTATRQQGEVGTTDNNGDITFGITSTETGTFSVLVFFDENNDNTAGGEFTATATKTFTAGFQQGNEAVEFLDCSPETDVNPEGTAHSFTCVATDINGNPVAGATVQFDVTAGPNATERGIINCVGSTTDAQGNVIATGQGTTSTQGQVTCTYTDVEDPDEPAKNQTEFSPPGTDTIVAFVNQTPGTGQTGTPGADTFEPQDTIQKTFVGDATTINCTPDGGTAGSGDVVTVTCLVSDETGQPIQGVVVNFTENGAGVFRGATTCTTGADGTCSVEVETGNNETGTVSVTGTIAPQSGLVNGAQPAGTNPVGSTNCQANGTPEPGTNAKCSDTATVTVTDTAPGLAQCEDGVDNDGDGRIDFPNDVGCANGDDNTENTEGTQPPPTEIRRERTLQITRMRHVFLPGKDKPALLVRGVVNAPTLPECASEVPVKIQIRAGGTWITRKSDTTNSLGVFKVLIRDVAAKYRAVAPKFQIEDIPTNTLNICLKARDIRRHRHGG